MRRMVDTEERDDAGFEELAKFDDAVAGDVRNPYPEMARQRRENPVQRLDVSGMPHDEGAAVFFIYGFDDIATVLKDGGATYSSAQIIQLIMGEVMGEHIMLGMDEPEHPRYRSLVSKAFRQKSIAQWEDVVVAQIANDLIDELVGRGRAELVRDFTFPFPTKVIASLLGLPQEDYLKFQRWSILILSVHGQREKAIAGSQELKEYLAGILAQRRAEPRDDLISELAHVEVDGEHLTDEEIFSFLRLLITAGIETTYRSTGNLLLTLLEHPDQLEAIRNDRSLIPQAIEELVRYEVPLLNITRQAMRDTELGGVPIPAGSTLMLMLGAANREEARWDDPDAFNIFREQRAHIGFGHGPHVCIGMHLARLEMRVALNLILDRLPDLRLDPDGDDPHIRGMVFRSPTTVPVLFGA